MEFRDFIKLICRHKLTLIIIPLLSIVITFFLVRNMPDDYTSNAQIATGIVDQTQQTLSDGVSFQNAKIDQEFNNLLEMIKLKKVLDQVSYQLIIHDLTSSAPFRKPSRDLEELSPSARESALKVYTDKYLKREALFLGNVNQMGLNRVLGSMQYDESSLTDKLKIRRTNSSDYITIEFQSEDPELSAFVVNTLAKEFISYYSILVKENQQKAVTFLGNLLKQKKDALDAKTEGLKSFKIQNRVLNLDEQAKSLYGQMSDFETRRVQAERDIIAFQGALDGIDSKFNPKDRRYVESISVKINQDILNTKEQMRSLGDLYIQNDFDEEYKEKIDSLKDVLTSQIQIAGDKYITNPLGAKENLVLQKIGLQIQSDLAQNSVKSIRDELSRLNIKFDRLVPNEAVVQSFENAIDIAGKEYLEILQKYNQTSMESDFSVQLRQVEQAMPGKRGKSKKMLLVILSGIISLVFCLVVLFILFYLDDSIKQPKDLADKTQIPVLGHLNIINGTSLDLKKMWNDKNRSSQMQKFKNLLQSIRFEIDQELNGNKVLAITSIKQNEGKTLFAISLAFAYTIINKRVLLIDGNFNNRDISKTVNSQAFVEDYINGVTLKPDTQVGSLINVLGNRGGGDISLLEINNENTIGERIQALKEDFDIIIIETTSLNTLNKSKEWMLFADKIIAVFEANQTITPSKKQHIQFLRKQDSKFIGWILNKVSYGTSAPVPTKKSKWYRKN